MHNTEDETKKISVSVTLSDGSVHSGSFIIGLYSSLARALNNDDKFLEFSGYGDSTRFFAKNSIIQIIQTDVPDLKKLEAGAANDSGFNPYRVLKIAPDADTKMIRDAYFKQAKLYHPDRFSTMPIPGEMAKYAEDMSRLINAAYEILKSQATDLQPEKQDASA